MSAAQSGPCSGPCVGTHPNGRGLLQSGPVGSPVTQFLSSWTFDPLLAAGMVAAALAYLAGVRRVRRRWPAARWPRSRTVWWLLGLAVAWFVTLGPIGAYDDVFFWSHMVQHLALMMLAAPLLMLAAPVTLLLRAMRPGAGRRRIQRILHGRVVRFLAHPVVAAALYLGTLAGVHFTSFYETALEHPLIHTYVEHPLFLCAGMLFYWSIIGVDPGPRRSPYPVRLGILLVMMPLESFVGLAIYSAHRVLYPFYLHVDRPFGPGPIADQQLGGSLMLITAMVVGVVWLAVAARGWYRHEQIAAAHLDRRLDAERSLSTGSA